MIQMQARFWLPVALALGFAIGAANRAALACDPRDAQPFASASLAPADVTLYVHIRSGAAIRRELADRPLADWWKLASESTLLGGAWSNLAAKSKVDGADGGDGGDGGALFDQLLGKRCTLLQRKCAAGPAQWAVISELDEASADRLLGQLRVRAREPHAGLALIELPEHEMLIGRDGRTLIAGPLKQPQLFYEVLDRIAGAERPSLATSGDLAKARELGAGDIAIFARHDDLLEGWSAIVASLRGDELALRIAGSYANPLFTTQVIQADVPIDFSPLLGFEDRALLALMQPTDIGDGMLETFLSASLGEPLISKSMRANRGQRRLSVVGEVEGRQLAQPVDVLSTTFVTCLELKEREHAGEHLDEHMLRLVARLNERGKGAFLIENPPLARLRSTPAREIDLSGASDWFAGGFPIMKNAALAWTVIEGRSSAWYAVGSNRQSLEEVAIALRQQQPQHEWMVGKFDNCGVANGNRIGRHLLTWCEQAEQFAEPGKAEELRTTLKTAAALAHSFQSCRWRLARPTVNDLHLDVQVQLAKPEATRRD